MLLIVCTSLCLQKSGTRNPHIFFSPNTRRKPINHQTQLANHKTSASHPNSNSRENSPTIASKPTDDNRHGSYAKNARKARSRRSGAILGCRWSCVSKLLTIFGNAIFPHIFRNNDYLCGKKSGNRLLFRSLRGIIGVSGRRRGAVWQTFFRFSAFRFPKSRNISMVSL